MKRLDQRLEEPAEAAHDEFVLSSLVSSYQAKQSRLEEADLSQVDVGG